MYAHKAAVLDYLAEVNTPTQVRTRRNPTPNHHLTNHPQVLEYALFQPGLLLDYFASPFHPSERMSTFPLLFDLLGARAVVVEDGSAPMCLTAASDVAVVVRRAVEQEAAWPSESVSGGGIVGERTDMLRVVETAERITGTCWGGGVASFVVWREGVDANCVAEREKV
jgi:hypothetical protein